jgi:hypothetical protein
VDFEAQRIITFRRKTVTGFAVALYPQVRPLLERLTKARRMMSAYSELRTRKRPSPVHVGG